MSKKKTVEHRGVTIQSVDRAVAILEVLSSAPTGLTLTEVAGHLGLPVQTTQGLLRTLQSHQLVIHLGRGKAYMVGPRLHWLSHASLNMQHQAALAHEKVYDLARRLNEYVVLVELRGTYSAAIVEVKPPHPAVANYGIGVFTELHKMSTGRVLIAYASQPRRELILKSLEAVEPSFNEPPVRQAFETELAQVREHGYSECVFEDVGMGSLAVPVQMPVSSTLAALGMSAPLARFPQSRRPEILKQLQTTARELSR